jgi:hypothetical protein
VDGEQVPPYRQADGSLLMMTVPRLSIICRVMKNKKGNGRIFLQGHNGNTMRPEIQVERTAYTMKRISEQNYI